MNTVGVFTQVATNRALLLRAIGLFAVGRLVTLAWILGVGSHRGMPMSQTIGYWDGSWYIQAAKTGCPISRLFNTTINMQAKLEG